MAAEAETEKATTRAKAKALAVREIRVGTENSFGKNAQMQNDVGRRGCGRYRDGTETRPPGVAMEKGVTGTSD
jgi:hypothetical protein